MSHLIAPSLLSADFLNLERDIEMINSSEADWFHIDVMDGVFVPNITIGFPVIKRIKQVAKKPLDVHLMIISPEKYFVKFKECGADILSVHFEGVTHLHRAIQEIKLLGMKAGIVLNPHTNIRLVEDILSEVDLICIMSVNPGFGGQKYIENSYKKISALKEMILRQKVDTLIEVDGGVDASNAKKLVDAGADVLVAGNYVFSAKSPENAISAIKHF
jgi:ribulose-phosphate 3-epimerase